MNSFKQFSSMALPNFSQVSKILLVGAGGKTGIAYTQLLLEQGKEVFVYDKNSSYQLTSQMQEEYFLKLNLVTEQEFQDNSILEKVEAVTLSPGVSLMQNIFLQALEKKIPVFSELEFSVSQLKNPILAITGTDGKSTVTALSSHLLQAFNLKAIACGNYGIPLSKLALKKSNLSNEIILCLELSSYQLELSRNLKIDAGIYLNLAADHLNRYHDLAEYGLAKWNILNALQENAILWLSKKLSLGNSFAGSLWKIHPSKMFPKKNLSIIDEENLSSVHFFWQQDVCYFQKTFEKNKSPLEIIKMTELAIQGKHNQSNLLFALEAVYFLWQKFKEEDSQKPQQYFAKQMSSSLKKFCGLSHRFEILPSKSQDIYINDSKATTCQATITALKNVSSPLYIFLGGKAKGEDYSVLQEPLQQRNAHALLFGEARNEIKDKLQNKVEIVSVCDSLKEAFEKAQEHKQKYYNKKAVIFLLSPAATSWDSFSSFEERGDYFKKLVVDFQKNEIGLQ